MVNAILKDNFFSIILTVFHSEISIAFPVPMSFFSHLLRQMKDDHQSI